MEHLFLVLALVNVPPNRLVSLQPIGHHIPHGDQQFVVQHQPTGLLEALDLKVGVVVVLGRPQGDVGLQCGLFILLVLLSRRRGPFCGP